MACIRLNASRAIPIIPTAHIPSPYADLTIGMVRRTLPEHVEPTSLAWLLRHGSYDALRAVLSLSLVDREYVRAVVEVTEEDHEDSATVSPFTISFAEYLVAIWPWLPQSFRQALTPFVVRRLLEEDQVVLAALDPDYPVPALTSSAFDRATVMLYEARCHGTTLTQDRILQMLLDYRPASELPCSVVTLIRHADPQTLRALYTQKDGTRMSQEFRRTILLSPQAPRDLLDQVVRKTPLLYRDVSYELSIDAETLTSSNVWLAPIDLSALDLPDSPRQALLTLGAWAQHPLMLSPQLSLRSTTTLTRILQQESQGAYADVASLIIDRMPRLPADIDPLNRPSGEREITAILNRSTTSVAQLALCFRAGMGRFQLCPDECLIPRKKSVATPDFVQRIVSHPYASVRRIAAQQYRLDDAGKARLLKDDDTRVMAEIMTRYQMTREELTAHLSALKSDALAHLLMLLHLEDDLVEQLSRHRAVEVRQAVALDQRLTSRARTRLLQDRDPHVRAAMAHRRDLTVPDILALSKHLAQPVAANLVSSPLTPAEVLDRIVARWGRLFYDELMAHPNLSEQTRITLAVQ